jgi:hypothetical protein
MVPGVLFAVIKNYVKMKNVKSVLKNHLPLFINQNIGVNLMNYNQEMYLKIQINYINLIVINVIIYLKPSYLL